MSKERFHNMLNELPIEQIDEMDKYMELYKQITDIFISNKTTLFDSYVVVSAMSSAILEEMNKKMLEENN